MKFDHTNKCYAHNPESVLENEMHKFWDSNGSPNLNQTTKPNKGQQKKDDLPNCGLCCLADYKAESKESKKKDKYLDLVRELKKLWNMKVAVIPIVIGVLGTITKGLVQGLAD